MPNRSEQSSDISVSHRNQNSFYRLLPIAPSLKADNAERCCPIIVGNAVSLLNPIFRNEQIAEDGSTPSERRLRGCKTTFSLLLFFPDQRWVTTDSPPSSNQARRRQSLRCHTNRF